MAQTERKVMLLACNMDPQKIVACGAKLCYSSAGVNDLMEGLTPEKTSTFIQMLSNLGHESPIEHAYFTFGIEGVSRSLLAQLTRHRIASYSVKSQRYVKEGQFDYIIPPEIEEEPEAKKLFIQTMEQEQLAYNRLTEILEKKHKKGLMKSGLSEKEADMKASKMAIEDARFVLPNACETKIVLSMNARSLKNFFKERCCNRAQWEIRALAIDMLRLVKQKAPDLFEKAGPPCLFAPCPEGKMTCGKILAVREYFTNLNGDCT